MSPANTHAYGVRYIAVLWNFSISMSSQTSGNFCYATALHYKHVTPQLINILVAPQLTNILVAPRLAPQLIQ